MKHRRVFLFICASLFAILAFGNVQAASKEKSVLTHFDGKSAAISDYSGKGKWLVVMLWASDCQVCNREASNYQAFDDKHNMKDAHILGVSLDGNEKLKDAEAFVKRHSIKFPNLIGEPIAIAQMYQQLTGDEWVGTPTFMVYNPKGELLGAQVGAVPVKIIEDFIKRESSAM